MEKHVCCDCKKTKKRHKLVDLFRFGRKGKVEEDGEEDGEAKGEVKENGELTAGEKVSGESTDAATSDIVKTEEKGSSFFWTTKREGVSAEKTTKQATEEELNKANVKTEEKTGGFFWNTKRETDLSEKTAKQATEEEELNEDTKTVDLATEVIILRTQLTSCCTYI